MTYTERKARKVALLAALGLRVAELEYAAPLPPVRDAFGSAIYPAIELTMGRARWRIHDTHAALTRFTRNMGRLAIPRFGDWSIKDATL